MKENTKLREELAELSHTYCVELIKDLLSKGVRNEDGSITIPSSVVERCEYKNDTNYEDLSESEKDSYIKETDKCLDVFENYLARCEEELENGDSEILLGRDPIYEALIKYMR